MTCGYCGTELPARALFCGVCGRSLAASASRTVAVAAPMLPVAANDTAIVELAELDELEQVDAVTVMTRSRPPEPAPEPEPEPAPAPDPEQQPEPDVLGSIVVNDPPPVAVADPWKPPTRLLPRTSPVDDDFERTRIVSTSLTGARFVLQFSTGESVTVAGSGLIGRNPTPEPAEYFDHVVTIVDPGKSVSKTHLEFGQVAGAFWVSDRFSGNGTVIREPDNPPRRCDPGKRYRVVRGTRVTMGEQFFVVS